LTVLVLDESGQEKAGCSTAGVKRQYVGCAGKVANAVNFVNATYSTPAGHALVGSRRRRGRRDRPGHRPRAVGSHERGGTG
jgi:hypothetical protein